MRLRKRPAWLSDDEAKQLGIGEVKKPSKFRNRPVIDPDTGKKLYDSQLEGDVHRRLVAAYGAEGVMQQVSIRVGSGNRMIVDFMVIHEVFEDGRFIGELIDAKGYCTKDWLAKARHLLDKFKLKVRMIYK